ncbi:hypothetical protein GC175_05855 [bacterium]|nr:hypothetical protein [bacterium]
MGYILVLRKRHAGNVPSRERGQASDIHAIIPKKEGTIKFVGLIGVVDFQSWGFLLEWEGLGIGDWGLGIGD